LCRTKKTKFTINPNPATSVVNLIFSNSEKGSITIVDALGRVVHKKTIQSTAETNLEQWNTEGVARGLYFVTFSFDNQVSTLKVMLK
jgi:Secretion system C-terminal sorting domain